MMLNGSLPHAIFTLVFLATAALIPATATETTVQAENTSSSLKKHAYPMWSGTRVNAPEGKGIPLEWHCGEVLDRGWHEKPLSYRGLRPEGARNIKWVARLGSQTYGVG